MFSRIRNRFGTAGLIVAVVALVAALAGTAFAATKLNSTQKKEVTKIAKNYAGKNGAAGATGAVGATGAPGPKGDAGAKGDQGIQGNPGTNGTNGKTVLNGTTVPVAQGTIGDFYIDTATDEIYGPKTAVGWGSPTPMKGESGFTDVLPAGETEKGIWAFGQVAGGKLGLVSISFVIPLAAAPEFFLIPSTGPENLEQEEECPGTAAAPDAEPGVLCLYATELNGTLFAPEVSENGAVVIFQAPAAPLDGYGFGSWAVTG